MILNGAYHSSASMSSSAKGTERESFIDEFLSKVLPTIYRFGTGDVTDSQGNKSGQLDIVVEHPFSPSLPTVGGGAQRLYLAESVATVIEVKSDISSQWSQAVHTANQLHKVKRKFGGGMTIGTLKIGSEIPLFVVAYKGWKQLTTVQKKLAAVPNIAGILIIEPGIFVSSSEYGGMHEKGPEALWGLICCLHNITASLYAMRTYPEEYV